MTADEAGERHLAPRLLVDLVLDPRDRGYEAAARARTGRHTPQWHERSAVAVICLVIGFLLALAWVHTHRGAPVAAKVHDRLVQRVRAAQGVADDLSRSETKLSADLERIRNAALAGSSPLIQGLDRARLLAGEVATGGPGLEVRLAEPKVDTQPTGLPGRGDPPPARASHILLDRDVRSVVNQLWSDGAEAIAVNGIRLTPTSAIRFAGDAVLVDFEPIEGPYVVDAIGNSTLLVTGFAASDVASRYQTLVSAKGIGFSFHEKDELRLPASPATTLRYSRVPNGRR